MKPSEPIVVLGGGPSGAAAAMQLRKAGREVIMLDRSAGPGPMRGEVMPPNAWALLRKLDLDGVVKQIHSVECHGIWSAWGEDELYEKNFIFNPYGAGLHLERAEFDHALLDATQASGVDLRREALVQWIEKRPDGGWMLSVKCGGAAFTLRAAGVVEATGRRCWLARKLGGHRRIYDQQIAIAARVSLKGKDAFPGITLVEAVPEGWWYSSPLPGQEIAVAFLSDWDLLQAWNEKPAAVWERLLRRTQFTQDRLAGEAVPKAGEVQVSMADTYRVHLPFDCGCVQVGAAALGVDPLSSSGICFALQSGRDGAQALCTYLDGSDEELAMHQKTYDHYMAEFLRQRQIHYLSERRFAASTYWRRRHSGQYSGDLRPLSGAHAKRRTV